jgi:hypothetical protein
MSETEDLANAMLAHTAVVIRNREDLCEICEAAGDGDDEAQVILGAYNDAGARYEREGFRCVTCRDRLSPTKGRIGAIILFVGKHEVGGSAFCMRCAVEHDDVDDFFAAFCRAQPPMQGRRA